MPWVEFTEAFRWTPHPHKTTRFAPGDVFNVTRACAAAALEAGAAKRRRTPNRVEAAALTGQAE